LTISAMTYLMIADWDKHTKTTSTKHVVFLSASSLWRPFWINGSGLWEWTDTVIHTHTHSALAYILGKQGHLRQIRTQTNEQTNFWSRTDDLLHTKVFSQDLKTRSWKRRNYDRLFVLCLRYSEMFLLYCSFEMVTRTHTIFPVKYTAYLTASSIQP